MMLVFCTLGNSQLGSTSYRFLGHFRFSRELGFGKEIEEGRVTSAYILVISVTFLHDESNLLSAGTESCKLNEAGSKVNLFLRSFIQKLHKMLIL